MIARTLKAVGAFALAVGIAASAQAAQFAIDPAHSFIQFRTKHLGYAWLAGSFNTFEGTFQFDPEAGPEAQSISLTIDVASIDTNHAERDKHLRSADFFDADQFPKATFVSKSFAGDANGGMLTGDLTLHGVTKEIAFEVRKIGEGPDPWGGYRAGFEGSFNLVRKDFGMAYDLGPAAETVEVHLFIEGVKQ